MAPDTLFTKTQRDEAIALAKALTSINDRLSTIESNLVNILASLKECNSSCSGHREQFRTEVSKLKERVNAVFTVGGVAVFLLGLAIKLRWL